jgi:pyruvate/2-oxoglutarate dehydrogenase complex dihydrolipoamide acyltransferase (E2) component
MTEGTLNEWKVKVGDKFQAGDVLLSLETDKASSERSD